MSESEKCGALEARKRRMASAEKPELFKSLLGLLGCAETEEELGKIAVMFIFDESYPRSDITSAVKQIEIEKGFNRA